MKRKIALSCAAVALTAAAFAHAAGPSPAERAVTYRQGVFHAIAWNFGPMSGMVKGEIPFDAKAFALKAERVAFLSTLPLEGFVPDSLDYSIPWLPAAPPLKKDNWLAPSPIHSANSRSLSGVRWMAT